MLISFLSNYLNGETDCRSPSSQVRGKRTPRKSPKEGRKGPLKITFSVERREKPVAEDPESSAKSLVDHSDSGEGSTIGTAIYKG